MPHADTQKVIDIFDVGLRARRPVCLQPFERIRLMTIRTPPENILDKILKLFGKERRVVIPGESDAVYDKLGPYVQVMSKRESFLKVLFRKKDQKP